MIPRIIHYCWFGDNQLPELDQKCIASWKKYLPEYNIMLWNEVNFDINIVPFTVQVAKVRRWGFIVDYIRAFAVYNYGGIYLDTDVELLKPFDDDLLNNKCFSGFENMININPGNIFAGEKGCEIAKELMEFYASYNFIKENGELNLTPSPVIFTNILLKYGLKKNGSYQNIDIFTAYPTEYFCPKCFYTGLINITKNTYSIHHFNSSWFSEEEKIYKEERCKIYKTFGSNIFSRIIILCSLFILRIKNKGLIYAIKWYYLYYRNKLSKCLQ
jgi:mannosyltransferase OCH1-like enzyme